MRMRRSSMLRCGVACSEMSMSSVHEKCRVAPGKRSSASVVASRQRGESGGRRVALYSASSAARAAEPAAGGAGSSAMLSGYWAGSR